MIGNTIQHVDIPRFVFRDSKGWILRTRRRTSIHQHSRRRRRNRVGFDAHLPVHHVLHSPELVADGSIHRRLQGDYLVGVGGHSLLQLVRCHAGVHGQLGSACVRDRSKWCAAQTNTILQRGKVVAQPCVLDAYGAENMHSQYVARKCYWL